MAGSKRDKLNIISSLHEGNDLAQGSIPWATQAQKTKTGFNTSYPSEDDFADHKLDRKEELNAQFSNKETKIFEVEEFEGLSFEQISHSIVLKTIITRRSVEPLITSKIVTEFSDKSSITINKDFIESEGPNKKTEKVFNYENLNDYYNKEAPYTSSESSDNTNPAPISFEKEFFRSNTLQEPLEELEAALGEKDSSSPKERLNRALDLLNENDTLAEIASKYRNQNLTPTYALYCLEQELKLITNQIDAYNNATKELTPEAKNYFLNTQNPERDFIDEALKATNAIKEKIPGMAKDFRDEFKNFIKIANDLELNARKSYKLVIEETSDLEYPRELVLESKSLLEKESVDLGVPASSGDAEQDLFKKRDFSNKSKQDLQNGMEEDLEMIDLEEEPSEESDHQSKIDLLTTGPKEEEIQNFYKPPTDSEIKSRIESKLNLIAENDSFNDSFNLKEKKRTKKNPQTKVFNSNKVRQVLAKVVTIRRDSKIEEENSEGWIEVWSDNSFLDHGDKSILAMLGLNDERFKKVFGSIDKPMLSPYDTREDLLPPNLQDVLTRIEIKDIMNVALKMQADFVENEKAAKDLQNYLHKYWEETANNGEKRFFRNDSTTWNKWNRIKQGIRREAGIHMSLTGLTIENIDQNEGVDSKNGKYTFDTSGANHEAYSLRKDGFFLNASKIRELQAAFKIEINLRDQNKGIKSDTVSQNGYKRKSGSIKKLVASKPTKENNKTSQQIQNPIKEDEKRSDDKSLEQHPNTLFNIDQIKKSTVFNLDGVDQNQNLNEVSDELDINLEPNAANSTLHEELGLTIFSGRLQQLIGELGGKDKTSPTIQNVDIGLENHGNEESQTNQSNQTDDYTEIDMNETVKESHKKEYDTVGYGVELNKKKEDFGNSKNKNLQITDNQNLKSNEDYNSNTIEIGQGRGEVVQGDDHTASATIIQKVFRGHKARESFKSKKEIPIDVNTSNPAALAQTNQNPKASDNKNRNDNAFSAKPGGGQTSKNVKSSESIPANNTLQTTGDTGSNDEEFIKKIPQNVTNKSKEFIEQIFQSVTNKLVNEKSKGNSEEEANNKSTQTQSTETQSTKTDPITGNEEEKKESHESMIDSEIEERIKLIAKNDSHNLEEGQFGKTTKFFNSTKVMRTLAKVHDIRESLGQGVNLDEHWKKVWGADKSRDINLTQADKTILAMLGIKNAEVEGVFGSIQDPKFGFKKIDDEKIKNIMNVASKLIDVIGSTELGKYSGKVENKSYKPHRKLDKSVTDRSLNFETVNKSEDKPSSSVGQAQAFKLSLISKGKGNAQNNGSSI